MGKQPVLIAKAVTLFGSQQKLAKAMGGRIRQSHVTRWLNDPDYLISPEHAAMVEIATKGAVTRLELRPDIFGKLPTSPPRRLPPKFSRKSAA